MSVSKAYDNKGYPDDAASSTNHFMESATTKHGTVALGLDGQSSTMMQPDYELVTESAQTVENSHS